MNNQIRRLYDQQRFLFNQLFLSDLKEPYDRFLKEELNEIVSKNEAITGAPCYLVGGKIFARGVTGVDFRSKILGGKVPLDSSLMPKHEDWFIHHAEHQRDWARFSQELRVLLINAPDWQDIRDMFPDSAIQPYEAVKALTRTRPSMQTALLQESQQSDCPWSSEQLQRYSLIGEKLDLYVGYRLL